MSEQTLTAEVSETAETPALDAPSRELAQRLLNTEVGFDERLVGLKMSAKGGSNPTPLYRFVDAANFIHVGDYEAAQRDNNATVGYIPPAGLAQWVEEIFGDAELAAAVREYEATGEYYGAIATPIKELLLGRIDQCRAVLAEDQDS